jgi:hypothetical protein
MHAFYRMFQASSVVKQITSARMLLRGMQRASPHQRQKGSALNSIPSRASLSAVVQRVRTEACELRAAWLRFPTTCHQHTLLSKQPAFDVSSAHDFLIHYVRKDKGDYV